MQKNGIFSKKKPFWANLICGAPYTQKLFFCHFWTKKILNFFFFWVDFFFFLHERWPFLRVRNFFVIFTQKWHFWRPLSDPSKISKISENTIYTPKNVKKWYFEPKKKNWRKTKLEILFFWGRKMTSVRIFFPPLCWSFFH